jgi:hypothetical protein
MENGPWLELSTRDVQRQGWRQRPEAAKPGIRIGFEKPFYATLE